MKNIKVIKFIVGAALAFLAYLFIALWYDLSVNEEFFGYKEIENPTVGFLEEVKKRYVKPINKLKSSDLDVDVFIRSKKCEFNYGKHIKVTINNIILDDLYILNEEFDNDYLYGVVKLKDSKIKYKEGKILKNLGFNSDIVAWVNAKISIAIRNCKYRIYKDETQKQIKILNERS